MPLVIDDRVRETTTVTGTNDASLLGAVTGFQSFAVIGNNNTTYYTIADQAGGNWEVGIGTYIASGAVLQRTTVLSSSNSGNKVSFPSGTKDVFVTYPSEKAVYLDESNNVQPALGIVNATTVDTTTIEVTNIRARDGTASASIANSTGTLTVAAAFAANGGTTIGDASGDAFTINSGAVSIPNSLNFDSNTFVIDASNNRVGIGNAAPTVSLTITATDAMLIPRGDTAARPTGVSGYLRFNTQTSEFEGFNGTAWASVGGSAITNDTTTASDLFPSFLNATSGTATSIFTSNAKLLYRPSTGEFKASALVATNGIVVNSQTISASYTIASGTNAMSSGPVTVASGQTVTVGAGSRWVVL